MKLDEAFIVGLVVALLFISPVGWLIVTLLEQFTREQVLTASWWTVAIVGGLLLFTHVFGLPRSKKTVF